MQLSSNMCKLSYSIFPSTRMHDYATRLAWLVKLVVVGLGSHKCQAHGDVRGNPVIWGSLKKSECALQIHLLLAHPLSVQVHIPHWFWLWRPWSFLPVQLAISVDLRGGGGRGGGKDRWRGGGRSTKRVCRGGRWRSDGCRRSCAISTKRFLP